VRDTIETIPADTEFDCGHWSSDLGVPLERRRRIGHEIFPLRDHRSIVFVEAQFEFAPVHEKRKGAA
jgi:hypothetical protein